MPSAPFPHPKGMPSFWQTAASDLKDYRSTPQLPTESEIVIIGGGYSAAALVTHILNESAQPPKIVVLEARQLCSGATGRNGGHIKPDPYWHASQVAAEHGAAAAAELADFELANLNAVKEYIEQESVDCDLVVTRACDVFFSHERAESARQALQGMQDMGVSAARDAYAVQEKHAETVSGVKGARGCVSFTAAHLWPYKLIHHMFRCAINRGVNLQTNTLVTKLAEAVDQNGASSWIVTTNRGVIRAPKVVLATNAYTAALLPEYKEKIIPYRGISCRIRTPGPAPLLVNSYGLRFGTWDFDYLIPRPDGSIIVGGARSAYFRDKELWYANTDDSQRVQEARAYFEGYMQRHFRGWEDSGAYVDDVWTGIMGYSSDKLPRLGPVPGRKGLFIMAGWTGHGMPQIFLASKGMAKMVVSGVQYSETGLPRVFEESEERVKSLHNKVLDSWHEAIQSKL